MSSVVVVVGCMGGTNEGAGKWPWVVFLGGCWTEKMMEVRRWWLAVTVAAVVVDDVYVGASTKDKKEYRPTPTRKDVQPRPNKIQKRNRRETFMRGLEQQEFLIEELKRRVAGLEAQLAEEKARRQNKDHGGESVPRTEPSMNTGFVSPTDIDTNQQPLKTYVRAGSRRRYKGRALRTPYTGTVVLRIKNE
ncbi:hypothetical protein LR48_Vigan695s000300 [Vigna angularis]|uniref:Uncharacterized protein n=1 Tax=Phaseolus angularis TaxID=3914 RepID=A0A0L9TGA7_PHAAN|nr:hypothetical protein LR48_Vigan695s000300 [Vigna angularis]